MSHDRVCTKCGLTKGAPAFRQHRRTCKICEYDRRDLSKEVLSTRRYRARNRCELNRKQRETARVHHRWCDALKNKPCVDCGIKYPPHVMDWDHVSGVKRFNLGNARQRYGHLGIREQILVEIAKCDLVCANCHR